MFDTLLNVPRTPRKNVPSTVGVLSNDKLGLLIAARMVFLSDSNKVTLPHDVLEFIHSICSAVRLSLIAH